MISSYKDLKEKIKRIHEISKGQCCADTIEADLSYLENRIGESKYYIGIVGETNAGKSTMLNAIIGDNLLPCESAGGSSSIPVFVEYGCKPNFRVEDKNGVTYSYSSSRMLFLKAYLPDIYSKLSIYQKQIIKAKDAIDTIGIDDWFWPVFRKIIFCGQETIKNVVLFYPVNILKNGIVLIDFPACNRWNELQNMKELKRIIDICDELFVVQSIEKEFKDIIRFIVTIPNAIERNITIFVSKIETLEKEEDIESAIEKITKIHEIKALSADVIPCPSVFLMYKENIIKQKLEWIDTKDMYLNALCDVFLVKTRHFIEMISKNKEMYICNSMTKIIDKCTYIIVNILHKKLEKTLLFKKEKEKNRSISIETFTKRYINYSDIENSYLVFTNKIKEKKNEYVKQYVEYIRHAVYKQRTKSEIQHVFNNEDVKLKAQSWTNDIYNVYENYRVVIFHMFQRDIQLMLNALEKEYALSVSKVEFPDCHGCLKKKNMRLKYDSSHMTTFLLFRMFKKLGKIRGEVLNIIDDSGNRSFNPVFEYYDKCLKKAVECYSNDYKSNVDKILRKNKKRIATIINKEKCELENITKVIEKMEQDLKMLNNSSTSLYKKQYNEWKTLLNKKEYDEALKCLLKSAEGDYPEALSDLAYHYFRGCVYDHDIKLAEKFARRGALLGYESCQLWLGQILRETNQKEQALQWFVKSGKTQGWSAFLAGEMYEKGEGVTKNLKQAIYWYRISAKTTNAYSKNAQEALKRLCVNVYEKGEYMRLVAQAHVRNNLSPKELYEYEGQWWSFDKRPNQFAALLSAAERGYPHAQEMLGQILISQVAKDLDIYDEIKSKDWLSKATVGYVNYIKDLERKVEGREPNAMDELGCIYYRGTCGKEKNISLAEKYYKMGAELGHDGCQLWLGQIMREDGRKREALQWFIKSGEQGQGWSAFLAGEMYEKGEGTEKNLSKAIKWYTTSAKTSNLYARNARSALERLGKSIS